MIISIRNQFQRILVEGIMKVYELSTIGSFHTQHNEDAVLIGALDDHIKVMAVMDGCSGGTESHFASTLKRKVLKKVVKELSFKIFLERSNLSLKAILKIIMEQLFIELNEIKSRLLLEREELLSTLLLAIVDTLEGKAELIAVGDGLVCCNGEYFEFEQDNVPDYLGYHLHQPFAEWYTQHSQWLSLEQIRDLSLSTDGIFTFREFDQANYDPIAEPALVDWMLKDREWEEYELMLKKKLLKIEHQFGLKPTDDLSILRIILASE